MPYPLPSAAGAAQTIGPIAISDFWETSPPNGAGLGPTNFSSIKAAEVVQHGFCSRYIDIPQIASSTNVFKVVADTVFTSFVSSIQGTYTCETGDEVGLDSCGFGVPRGCLLKYQNYAHVAPYLRIPSDANTEQHGGAVFGAAYRLQDEGDWYNGMVGDNWVKLNIAIEFSLTNEGGVVGGTDVNGLGPRKLDGKLTANPVYADSSHAGGGKVAEMLEESLVTGIEKQVGDAVYALTDSQLVYPGIGATECTPRATNCDGSVTDQTVVYSAYDDPGAQCAAFIRESLLTPLATGSASAGLTMEESVAVAEQMVTTHLVTDSHGISTTVYDHIRCNSNPNSGTPYRCEYEFPVKRLNILPDQVELVLFDDAGGPGGKEIGNRAYGVYLAVLGLIGGGLSAVQNPFCQDPTLPKPGYMSMRRSYQVYTEGQVFVDRQSSAATCRGCSALLSFGDILNFFGDAVNAFF